MSIDSPVILVEIVGDNIEYLKLLLHNPMGFFKLYFLHAYEYSLVIKLMVPNHLSYSFLLLGKN